MKQKRLKSIACTLLLAALCLPACNNDDEGLLPDGKYPLTLTASIDKLTLTRAEGKSAWAIDDPIAVSVDDGTSHKIYKITNASTGAMEANNPKDPCYWIQDKGQRILAWYPANVASETDISDQSAGFAAFDYLTSDGTYNRTSSNVTLPFKHQMAKVKYTLKAGEGITENDLSSATVQIYGFTKASFDKGVLNGNTNDWITPYATDREALLVPQQMQSMDFIKVTVDGNDFYYTPKDENDANLRSGKQYTYKITVKKTGLEVSVDTPVSWKDDTATSGTVKPTMTFNVTCPGNGNGVEYFEIVGVNPNSSGDKYEVSTNTTITISYKTALKRSRYNLVQGIAKVSTSTDPSNGTITLAVSDIRGDLVFSFDEYAEVGDYYYADGTWSPDYPSGSSSAACIGIVFKVGAGTGDDASYYDGKLSKGIHGYVAALKDANDGNQLAWSTETTATGVSTSQANFDGYSNTQIIKRISGYETKYPAFQSCIENNGTAAPDASSGWYLPSCAQIKAFHDVRNSVDIKFNTASGELLITNDTGDYWTSNEDTNDRTKVWHYSTYYPPYHNDNAKTESNKDLVRAILTF